MKDKGQLILFSLLCASLAWLFWYVLNDYGFYIIGAMGALSIARHCQKKWKTNHHDK